MKIIILIVGAYIFGFLVNGFISGHSLFLPIFTFDNNQANIIIAYGTWAAVIVALVVAVWGRTLKTWFYNPQISILEITRFNHHHRLDVWRLAIKNTGNDSAKVVQVDIVEIIDDKNKKRENFLSIPLRWTHIDKEYRDILPGQTVYLDVFEQISQGDLPHLSHYLRLGSRYAQEIKDFSFLKPGISKIKLKLFQQNGKSQEIIINAKWDGNFLFDAGLDGKQMYWEKKEEEKNNEN